MANGITNICELINHFEKRYGNLNEFFYAIYEGYVSDRVMMELMYLYDDIYGLGYDFEEYVARFGDRPFEWKLDKIKIIATDVINTIKHSPNYKPVEGVVNRNKDVYFNKK